MPGGVSPEKSTANNYIEIPVLARYDVKTTGPAHPFFLAGPALAFQVSCNAEGASGGVSASASCDAARISKKTCDLGGALGAGVAFPAGKTTHLSVSVRYELGFADTFDNSDSKNRAWSFLAGLTF